ncbi:Hypothetical predicted protein [Podarcis lilfordi]|uniref:Uncharacterized protein n=1 Tax=Podarcis lilfordi TaxID=74358 RepID=A0AA35JKV9_9SAUR|nr:Hypothetical predicted protein [Podarcis lilfordi]
MFVGHLTAESPSELGARPPAAAAAVVGAGSGLHRGHVGLRLARGRHEEPAVARWCAASAGATRSWASPQVYGAEGEPGGLPSPVPNLQPLSCPLGIIGLLFLGCSSSP